jgi:hypothetical protein
MESVVFSVGAALRSEKTRTAKRINQCGSFVKLAIVAKGLDNYRTDEGRNIISFDCDEFGVVEEHSSKEWEKLFSQKKQGKSVVINVSEEYILGPIIPGYH